MVDWMKDCISVKIAKIGNCTVVLSLNTAVFRSKGLECMYGWEKREKYTYVYKTSK